MIVVEQMWNLTTTSIAVLPILLTSSNERKKEYCAKDVKKISEIYKERYQMGMVWYTALKYQLWEPNPLVHTICRRLQTWSKKP